VDLGSLIGAALDAVRPAAEARTVTPRVAGPVPLVQADPHRLQQVVWNLLSNAVRFTETGGTVAIEVREADGDRVCLRVMDDGAGIAPSFLPDVFERLRQGDGSRKPSACRIAARARDRPPPRRAARRDGER
jgi:signal transduction histidine kinase